MHALSAGIMQALLERMRVEMQGDCIVSRLSPTNGGYVQLNVGGKRKYVHRLTWEIFNGKIPFGKDLLHSCDVRNCVRLEHLRIGSHQENMRDMVSRGRQGVSRGEKHGNAKLKDEDIPVIRFLYENAVSQTTIGDMFGVTQSTIHMIVSGKYWRHI